MARERSIRALGWASVALVAIVGMTAAGWAGAQQQPAPAAQAVRAAEAPAEAPVPEQPKEKKREFRGRLPAYYGRVVDQKQRETIYAIQREYAPRVDALKRQLAALMAERDKKVAAVLTPEQLNTVEKLRAEAKAKRARAKAAAK